MKSKRFLLVLISLLIISSMVLSACGGQEPEVVEEPEVGEEPMDKTFLACQVTDVGGIDDKSFNATAWKGMQDAVADFGIEAKSIEKVMFEWLQSYRFGGHFHRVEGYH